MEELKYNDRKKLTEGKDATLIYESPYTKTRVEQHVTIEETTGKVTVTLEDGTEWGIFGGGIRTAVNNRRQSGTVDPKNGRRVGFLVDIEQ